MHQLCREFVPAKRIAAGLIQIGQPLVLKQQKQESLTCFIRFYLTVDFNDYEFFKSQMDRLMKYYENIRLVSGHARGADTLAEHYAAEKKIQIQIFPAEWKKYGKAAGPIRNRTMLEYAKEETPVVAAFWNGKSRGTGNMIKQAKAAGAECHIFLYERESEVTGHAEGSGVI